MVSSSQAFSPVLLRGLKIDPRNPLLFNFIVDRGDSCSKGQILGDEGKKLIKYFLTALTVPSAELWVNLSPYEGNRMIPAKLGQTEMGRDMLAQDDLLKQFTASLMNPNRKIGEEFWKRVYAKAQAEFGTTDIPLDTFNKVWIMPDKAKVIERGQNVYVVEARMKVLVEQDYLALKKTGKDENRGEETVKNPASLKAADIATDILREIIIPELTREVNAGRNFTLLRQIHYSLVLAAWYEQKIKDSLLGRNFFGQNKVAGYESGDPQAGEKIYVHYLESLRKGAYSLIQEAEDSVTHELVPRKYFSGGYKADKAQITEMLEKVDAPFLPVNRLVSLQGELRVIAGSAPDNATALDPKERAELEASARRVLMEKLKLQGLYDPLSVEYFMGLYQAFLLKKGGEVGAVRLISRIDSLDKGRLVWLLKQKNAGSLPMELESELDTLSRKLIKENQADLYILDAVAPDNTDVLSMERIKEEMSTVPENEYSIDRFTSFSLDAGLGTSVRRTPDFLERWFQRRYFSSKAADMPVDRQGTPLIAVKMRQLIGVVRGLLTRNIQLKPIVNAESNMAYKNIMESLFPGESKIYYQVLYDQGVTVAPVVDPYYPSVDPDDGITLLPDANASGSHGGWWMKILAPLSAGIAKHLGIEKLSFGMMSFSNNDGANNHFPIILLRWMKKNSVPVVMVATPATAIDAKGGKFGLRIRVDENGTLVFERVMLELKSAQLAGQGDEFIATGLPGGIGEVGRQPFNTNSVGMNAPMLGEILDILFSDVFHGDWQRMQKILLPDLIDGRKPFGIQLEGALGTAVLKLHNYIENSPEAKRAIQAKMPGFDKLVTIVNLEKMSDRIRYFTPGKFAIDYFWMFWSDSFFLNRYHFWEHHNGDALVPPNFHLILQDEQPTIFYEDIGNLMNAFEGVDWRNIHELEIRIKNNDSPVVCPGAKMSGVVRISSLAEGTVNLNDYKNNGLSPYYQAGSGTLYLKDIIIEIDADRNLTVRATDAGQGVNPDNPGGIDFALNNFALDVDFDGQRGAFDFDPAQLNNGHFDRIMPEIRRIVPITNMSSFFGQQEAGLEIFH